MLDRRVIAKNPETVRKALARRGAYAVEALDRIIELEERWRSLKAEGDELRHQRKQKTAEMMKMRGGKGQAGGGPNEEDVAALRRTLGELSKRVKEIEVEVRRIEEERRDLLLRVPNLPDESVPDGADETGNVEVARWGTVPAMSFVPKPHWELGESLGILDFEAAGRMSGSRFAVLLRQGAAMERALISFMLDLHVREHGYTEVWPPYLVRRHAMEGTGQLPNLEEDAYRTAGDDPYFLIPTAEVPLVNLHREQILEPEQLPLRYVAYTPCFRAEAGSHGKDVRGLMRQHQFSKVELVQIVRPEDSDRAVEELRSHAEEVLRRLGLPYRVMLLCAGDMGFSAAKTFDLEAWVPAQGRYREISSCSNCTDFQARRATIRYRHAQGDNRLVHTLNGSGLAVGRTIIAILENYQQEDGSVVIPEALRPYMGGMERIEPKD